MANCEQIARLISEGLDHDLPWPRRAAVRLHLLLCRCPMCRGYERQMRAFRQALQCYREALQNPDSSTAPGLPDEARDRIRVALESGS